MCMCMCMHMHMSRRCSCARCSKCARGWFIIPPHGQWCGGVEDRASPHCRFRKSETHKLREEAQREPWHEMGWRVNMGSRARIVVPEVATLLLNGSGLLFAEVLLRDWKFFSALQPSSIRFDSIRFDCRRPLPRVPRGVHFHLRSGANPHPSQVSWTHASPPAHLLLPWLHSHARCTAAPPPCAATPPHSPPPPPPLTALLHAPWQTFAH